MTNSINLNLTKEEVKNQFVGLFPVKINGNKFHFKSFITTGENDKTPLFDYYIVTVIDFMEGDFIDFKIIPFEITLPNGEIKRFVNEKFAKEYLENNI